MGCDIHMHVERRSSFRNGDKTEWVNGDYFSIKRPHDPECKIIHQDLYGDRNYDLFAVLANVRNRGYGEALPYIDEPRGLPNDVTEYVKADYESWDWDAHSCSYFTLRELIDFHEVKRPKNDFGYDILEPLIERLKQRADDFNIIYNFEWDRPMTDDLKNKMDDIRIVFWFDN